MCGIVGYIGHRKAQDLLIDGLRRLEYRGYDSAGLAIHHDGMLNVVKRSGRIANLDNVVSHSPMPGSTGIGHTRWATHGAPTDINAHPHFGGNQSVVLVHNGVIENYQALRQRLQSSGYEFASDTDTEIIAHLIDYSLSKYSFDGQPSHINDYLIRVLEDALSQLKGTYGIAVLFKAFPNRLLAARLGSPLVLGIGKEEHFLASDSSALVGLTQEVIYMKDHEIAILDADELHLVHSGMGEVQPQIQALGLTNNDVELGNFDHFMLKEIHEQPESIENAMRGRLRDDDADANFGGLNLTAKQLREVDRIIFTACGTSWHAALVGEYLFEELARIPVEVEYASEFRYRNPPIPRGTLIFAISQSGETADTLAALRESKRMGHPTLGICNVVGSSIAREADGGVYLHAGPEIGVASTKAFSAQVVVLTLLALHLGRMRHLSYLQGSEIIQSLRQIPRLVSQTLNVDERVREIASKYAEVSNILYLGRHYNFPVALEGALKLKEVSYIHAEGYPAAEMKHGPIALVDKNTPSVFIIPKGVVYHKVMSNLTEIKARGGPLIAIACEGDEDVASIADDVIYVPDVEDYLQPLITAVPLQLLAYHIAVLRGCDVDKPRNLAKSVTVE